MPSTEDCLRLNLDPLMVGLCRVANRMSGGMSARVGLTAVFFLVVRAGVFLRESVYFY